VAASDSLHPNQFTVHTQHQRGEKTITKRSHFPDFDSALAHGESLSPDTDGSMLPNVDENLAHHPRYEKGLFWHSNRYGVITRKS
jgi:hypothetical protein